MKTAGHLIKQLQQALDQVASQKTKQWWQKYLREVIPFRGVAIPEIRNQLAQWREASGLSTWEKHDQLLIALQLFESSVAEDKLAGILYLQDYLFDRFEWKDLVEKYRYLYLNDLIFDWNTCDWFCVRVLGPTIANNGLPCAEAIAGWARTENLWQARSSVVAFVPVSADSRYYPLIYRSCHFLIRREERFAKTGVGWILRELSKHDQNGVQEFVQSHLESFSRESIKNALKYFNDSDQKSYLKWFKTR
ncbi:MAG: DNA alkylation repair protein [Acidobacteriota bacterium]